jgi:hypothetical protein
VKRRLTIGALASIVCHGLSLAAEGKGSIPDPLRGKSIEVVWTSSWTTKNTATSAMYVDRVQEDDTKFYFSTLGRIFSRRQVTHKFGRGEQLSVDAVDTQGGHPLGFFSQITFGGRTIRAVRGQGLAGALQLVVQFNTSFDACTASVRYGRSSGAVIYADPFSGRRLELVDMKINEASCKVLSGNIFE